MRRNGLDFNQVRHRPKPNEPARLASAACPEASRTRLRRRLPTVGPPSAAICRNVESGKAAPQPEDAAVGLQPRVRRHPLDPADTSPPSLDRVAGVIVHFRIVLTGQVTPDAT